MTNLEKYLYQLRRIEEHREKKAEKEIRKIYKELLKELNGFLGNIYATYSEDDMLHYADLAKAGMDARFLEEVEQRINSISPKVSKEIQETVQQTYEACYDGMRNAVVKAAGNRELLQQAFATVQACTPEVIRAAVNNPVSGLTLKDTLEKHRKEIIYDIKKNIGVGLSNGDRFSTMAKRIAESLDGDYTKAVRIVRTEAHRVRETGFNDAATAIDETLKKGTSGYVMAKTWHTMQDERVRPQKQKRKKYNHVKMDGVTIPQNELFKLPSGATCKAPSQTGVAGEDINCRCYLSYDLVLASELTGSKAAKEPEKEKVVDYENDFARKFGKSYYDEIDKRVRQCTNTTAADVWRKNEKAVVVADANNKGVDHCSGKNIYVNGAKDSKGSSWNAKYETTFHESGHAIDNLNGAISYTYKNGIFPSTIKEEVDDLVNAYDKAIKAEFKAHKGDIDYLYNKGYIGRWGYESAKRGGTQVKYSKVLAYEALKKEICGLDPMAMANISDILEGATGAKIQCGYGHGKSYWEQRKMLGVNVGLAKEAFAEMVASTFANEKSLETIKKYLPKSYAIFEEMLKMLAAK